jgi:hypothetical protein
MVVVLNRLAGGQPLQVGGVKPEAWLVGYRSGKTSVDFAPQNLGTVFSSNVDACSGKFELSASLLNRRLRVVAQAARLNLVRSLSALSDCIFLRNSANSLRAFIRCCE